MTWAEYNVASLDLSEDGGIVDSRPYQQGGLSLDGTIRWARFINGETPWSGSIAIYETAEEARARKASSDYTPAPTAEEQQAEEEAMSEQRINKLNQLVDSVILKYTDGASEAGYRYDYLNQQAQLVADGGFEAGISAVIDDLVTQSGLDITPVTNNVLNDTSQARYKIAAAENMRRVALMAIQQGDTEKQQEVRAALIAL